MIPTLLGNIVGGGVFVGAIYWYLYLTGVGPDEIKFDLGGLDTAMEAGGPMDQSNNVIEGQNPEVGNPDHIHSVPSTSSHMGSGIGRELNAEKYAKPKGDILGISSEKV